MGSGACVLLRGRSLANRPEFPLTARFRSMARGVLAPIVALSLTAGLTSAAGHRCGEKLDAVLRTRAHVSAGASRVMVRTADPAATAARLRQLTGASGRSLPGAGLLVASVADERLCALAAASEVLGISLDRPVQGVMERAAGAIGARWVREQLALDGKGVGIALIDSGVTASHDDLESDRVVHFVDFVNFRNKPYDDYGHGTHVAGIVAGNGRSSEGARIGVAPGANLVVLKALDGAGFGYTSNVIAAVDYAIANRRKYNIRVINLSVAAGVYESYTRDPLTLAARRAVDAGIVVVAAAGNLGRNNLGKPQYGGIAAPGNAPWVLTVGAATHNGTVDRSDDAVAPFSSRGPSAIDRSMKPDLVAPGVGIESIADPSTVLFAAHPNARLWGTVETVSEPYLRLSGTSMASPVVAATAALMLQANPALTPNAVKAILQFTAESRERYDVRTQGAGFLNARGAVELARAFGDSTDARRLSQESTGDPVRWSRQIIWGNRQLSGGTITAAGNAWQRGVVWGASTTAEGEPVVWGTLCAPADPACTGAPWTINCEPGSKGCPAASPADSGEFGEELASFADMWLAAAGVDHGLLSAGSISDPIGHAGFAPAPAGTGRRVR